MLALVAALATALVPSGLASNGSVSDHLVLWVNATGELILRSSTSPPLRALYGSQHAHMSAPLVHPPESELCSGSAAEWHGAVVLGGDWTAPGCSMETRARNLEAAGAAATIFKGTEGIPFDWDGSDREGIQIAVMVLSLRMYARVAEAADAAAANSTQGELSIWLAPTDTPLLHDSAFVAFQRAMQIVFTIAASLVMCLAVRQLRRFTSAGARSLQAVHAQRVIALELLSTAALLIFIIDGPGQEHTRPAMLPWWLWRTAQSLQVELHIVATIFFASHLRRIRKRVENTNSSTPARRATRPGKDGKRQSSLMSFVRKGSQRISRASFADDTAPSVSNCCAVDMKSRQDVLFVMVMLVFVAVDFSLAVFQSNYVVVPLPEALYAFTAFVVLNVGIWFMCQASIITRALDRGGKEDQGNNARVDKLSRTANSMGRAMVAGIVSAVANSLAVQPMLQEDGGMTYWWVLLPLWCLFIFLLLLASTLQIIAFQPPGQRHIASRPSEGRAGERRSVTVFITRKGVDGKKPLRASCSPAGLRAWMASRVLSIETVALDRGSDQLRGSNMPSTCSAGRRSSTDDLRGSGLSSTG